MKMIMCVKPYFDNRSEKITPSFAWVFLQGHKGDIGISCSCCGHPEPDLTGFLIKAIGNIRKSISDESSMDKQMLINRNRLQVYNYRYG